MYIPYTTNTNVEIHHNTPAVSHLRRSPQQIKPQLDWLSQRRCHVPWVCGRQSTYFALYVYRASKEMKHCMYIQLSVLFCLKVMTKCLDVICNLSPGFIGYHSLCTLLKVYSDVLRNLRNGKDQKVW